MGSLFHSFCCPVTEITDVMNIHSHFTGNTALLFHRSSYDKILAANLFDAIQDGIQFSVNPGRIFSTLLGFVTAFAYDTNDLFDPLL